MQYESDTPPCLSFSLYISRERTLDDTKCWPAFSIKYPLPDHDMPPYPPWFADTLFFFKIHHFILLETSYLWQSDGIFAPLLQAEISSFSPPVVQVDFRRSGLTTLIINIHTTHVVVYQQTHVSCDDQVHVCLAWWWVVACDSWTVTNCTGTVSIHRL